MITVDINERLNALCNTLGKNSLNYAVNIRLYPALGLVGCNLADIVTSAFGHSVVIGGAQTASPAALIEGLKEGLGYSGDNGSHPNLAFISSTEFEDRKNEILKYFSDLLSNADRVVSFWLKEGHPFYPVFWDFAYMVEMGADAYVFIGSSSD
jgi:hypothetical protein